MESGENNWHSKGTCECREHHGRAYGFTDIYGNRTGAETVDMARDFAAIRTVDPLYCLFNYRDTETVTTNAERSQILDFRISSGVTKLRYVFIIDQAYYDPLEQAHQMLMNTKEIDAQLAVFPTLEEGEAYLFKMLSEEQREQVEL